MLDNIVNPINNLSYTNKDFESIYPELLDLVKSLTYKWDPSISNESDPGVILLKLNAIIADKCNYNLDKNVLECFPNSVTQQTNARKLYDQLGYYMHWYKSSSTQVSLRWQGPKSDSSITIPAFTMVSDADRSIVYSLLGNSENELINSVGDIQLKRDQTIISVKALQGVAVNYTINGSTLITANYLDAERKLYFDSLDVAENGIFIRNEGQYNYSDWTKKDNLFLQSPGTLCFKFGVSEDGQSCYIQFPEDYENLIKSGIRITYIKTLGALGNIPAKTLERFYNDLSIQDEVGTATLNSSNVYITNASSATTGEDPESLNDAYNNYQKIVGTFDTLVTLRDYINAIYNSGLVSNDFVCDRTNDIQSSYSVMVEEDGIQQTMTQVDMINENQSQQPLLNAYSLKLYLLQYASDVSTIDLFNSSFQMLNNKEQQVVKEYLKDQKCISHDYEELLMRTSERSNFCYFKNKYPLTFKVLTQYKLTDQEIASVKSNIMQTLYDNLNANKLDFGEEIPYSYVSQIITKSDKRIKYVYLDNINYETYAVYLTENGFQEINLSQDVESTDPSYAIIQQFRNEIYAKSVLAGVTQLFIKDEKYDYRFDQVNSTEYENIRAIETNTTIQLSNAVPAYSLKDNEAIYLSRPNIQDIQSFSSGVWYQCYLANNQPIKADSSYQLNIGEWIIFYYSTGGVIDAYSYTAYGAGSIVNPNFTLNSSGLEPSQINPAKNYINELQDSGYGYEFATGVVDPQDVDALRTAGQLVGTRKISTQRRNKITLNDDYQCYWILNTVDKDAAGNDVYKLSFTDQVSFYTLKTGEYFLYTDKNFNDLIILGSGTKIQYIPPQGSSTEKNLYVPKLTTPENILQNGIDAISTWYTPQNGELIEVEEMYFLLIPAGSNIAMEPINTASSWNVTIQSSGADYQISGVTTPTLSDFIFKYQDPNISSEYVILPQMNIENITWSLKSLMSINVSSTQAQRIYNGQSLIIHTQQSSESITDKYLLADTDFYFSGLDGYADTSYYNTSGQQQYLSLILFNKKDNTDKVTYQPNGSVLWRIPVSGSGTTFAGQDSISFTLLPGKYLIGFKNLQDLTNVSVKIKRGSSAAQTILPINQSQCNKEGLYYFLYSLDTTANITLSLSCSSDKNSDCNFILTTLYKFNVSPQLNQEQFDNILSMVVNLDVNHKFIYDYQVPESVLIIDPLDPKEFLNKAHIYNQFTICQMLPFSDTAYQEGYSYIGMVNK